MLAMLAEFGAQKEFIDKLPSLRTTFERFVQKGYKNPGCWERTEALQYNGELFLLKVNTLYPVRYLLDANLVITVSGPDGRGVEEILPSRQSLIDNHNAGDYVELPGRLRELQAVVDEFLNPQVRVSRGTGAG